MQFTCLNTISFGDIPSDRMNGASTLSSIFFQMSTGLGVAFGAIVLQAANVLYSSGANTPTLADFRIAFIVMALISVLALIDVVPLPAEAGAQVSGHRSSVTRPG
jgi:hypothetical protein